MASTRDIFQGLSSRFIPGGADTSYYFSVGDEKWTVVLSATDCQVTPGKAIDNADCVLKCTPALFEKMVLEGKNPGALDIARGRIKTNDTALLAALRTRFRAV